jgi:hypothetical protein
MPYGAVSQPSRPRSSAWSRCGPMLANLTTSRSAQGVAPRGCQRKRPKDEAANNPENNPTKPAQEFRKTLEMGASQARDTYEKMGSATTERVS